MFATDYPVMIVSKGGKEMTELKESIARLKEGFRIRVVSGEEDVRRFIQGIDN